MLQTMLLEISHEITSLFDLLAIPLAFARTDPGWQFDFLSAVIGFVLGVLAALAVYLLRHRLAALRERVIFGVMHARDRLSTGVADRYREYLIDKAEQSHLLRHDVPLSQVYVEPLFDLPPFGAESTPGEAQDVDVWRDQRLHDLFYPRPKAIRFGDALKQSSQLAILGPVGSGRTTALLRIGQQFAQREGWRLTIVEPKENESTDIRIARNRERERLPVWLDLSSLDLSLGEAQERHALVNPIADYVSASLHRLIAAASASTVRAHLIDGRALVLCDNLDLLDLEARQRTLAWLDKLCRAYEGNVVVVGGQPDGYVDLLRLGFGILFLNGFRRQQIAQLVGRWQSLCEAELLQVWEVEAQAARVELEEAQKRARALGHPPPDEAEYPLPEMPAPRPGLLSVWKEGRGETVLPLDLAMASLLWRNQGQIPSSRLMRFAQTAIQMLGQTENSVLSPPHWSHVLGALAWSMHQHETYQVERSELESRVLEVLSQTVAQSTAASSDAEGEEPQRAAPDMSRLAHTAIQALLQRGDLLVDAGRGRVAFVHPMFRAYLAAQYIARSDQGDALIAYVRIPHWQDTLRFYAALASPESLVVEQGKGADDIFHSNVFFAAECLSASPEGNRQLLGGVLAKLAQTLIDPQRPVALRRQSATILALSDPKSALYVFGQATRNADPQVRALGVYGLGQLKDDRIVAGLIHALSDPDRLVRSGALHALARRGGEQAIEGLVQGLQDEDDVVRRVAAEALALWPDEGHAILRDAIQGKDMYIRRAAIFGLGQIEEPWAVAIIDPLSREDKEWFVRSAAAEMMEILTAGAPPLRPEYTLEDAGWLMTWAAQHGTGLGTGDAAYQMLLRALREGDWSARLAAADTMRALGDQRAVEPLTPLLKDKDVLVRNAAHNALCEIARRTGERIVA
ncbi:MAG: HEAT repeat domain-containing protein [Anaerolineae bacterium]|nr:HEAT repeat domain-containing protein [Anaerolineae bacterium]